MYKNRFSENTCCYTVKILVDQSGHRCRYRDSFLAWLYLSTEEDARFVDYSINFLPWFRQNVLLLSFFKTQMSSSYQRRLITFYGIYDCFLFISMFCILEFCFDFYCKDWCKAELCPVCHISHTYDNTLFFFFCQQLNKKIKKSNSHVPTAPEAVDQVELNILRQLLKGLSPGLKISRCGPVLRTGKRSGGGTPYRLEDQLCGSA